MARGYGRSRMRRQGRWSLPPDRVARRRESRSSGSVADGQFRATPGSLAEVLPPAFKQLFVSALAASDDPVVWTGPGGQVHEFDAPKAVRANAEG